MRGGLLISLGLLTGCSRLEATDGLVAPLVVQGLYLGLDLPGGVDFEGSDVLDYSAACTVFLAYVSDPAAIEEAPVEGAQVEFRSEESGKLGFAEEGEGKYGLTAADGLDYEPRDPTAVVVEANGETARIDVLPPEAPEVELPTLLDREQGFTVDLSGQGYDNVLVAVYDLDRSKLTWTNLPEGVSATYDYTHPDGAIETLEVPGEAVLRASTYVIGAAGMRKADSSSFENVNLSLSAFMAGQFSVGFAVVP